jgi:hypothetical protein
MEGHVIKRRELYVMSVAYKWPLIKREKRRRKKKKKKKG